jgi:hypothetical protein
VAGEHVHRDDVDVILRGQRQRARLHRGRPRRAQTARVKAAEHVDGAELVQRPHPQQGMVATLGKLKLPGERGLA